jgi:hypothetical protein
VREAERGVGIGEVRARGEDSSFSENVGSSRQYLVWSFNLP